MKGPFRITHSLELETNAVGKPAETVHFCVRPPSQGGRPRRAFTEKDLFLLILQGVLRTAVALLPPRAWRRICTITAQLPVLSRRRKHFPAFAARVQDVLGPEDENTTRQRFAAVQRRLHERQATCLRENSTWPPPLTEVHGINHLETSLGAGRGAILWNTPALGDTIITKRALFSAGYPVHQLSVRSHGFSQSPFAIRHVNPRQIAIEDRFLAGRVLFDGEDTVRAIREVKRRLGKNAAVMFTNSTFSGRSFVLVPFGKSTFLPLATTPMNLSVKLCVPLHVVTTVEIEPFRRYITTISLDMRSVAHGGADSDDQALARITLRVRDTLRQSLREAPDQIRLWDPLVSAASFTSQHLTHGQFSNSV